MNPPTEAVERVAQTDRDAVADYRDETFGYACSAFHRGGERDDDRLIVAFARHRTAALHAMQPAIDAAVLVAVEGERVKDCRSCVRKDRQSRNSQEFWVRAAKRAMAGDFSELRNRVEMAEAPPVEVVLSTPTPAIATMQGGE